MKKFLFYFSILFFSTASAQTNIYHPFPDSNAVWNVSFVTPWACPWQIDLVENYSYVLSGDTTINNTVYNKINVPFVQANCTGGPHSSGYAGCIRQDTSLRQVYFIWRNDTVEKLLYDFNWEPGDTVTGCLVSYWNCISVLTISAIDSIIIDSSYRKRWHVVDHLLTNVATFIEGIGSAQGLLESICPMIDGPIPSLMCFQQNGQSVYPNPNAQCNTIVSVQEHEILNNEAGIFLSPNPFDTELDFHFSTELNTTAHLVIFNSMGAVVLDKTMRLENQTFNLSTLPHGIYLVSINSDTETWSQKILKLQ